MRVRWGFPGGSDSKACNAGDLGRSLGREDPLEEGAATHSSVLARNISTAMGSQPAMTKAT